jgi:CHAT domain-containing protein/tetratricopeptide (TPR) repeat protein
MPPATRLLSLATLTALLVPASEVAAAHTQKLGVFEETQLLLSPEISSTSEAMPESTPASWEIAAPQYLAQANSRQAEADRLYQQGVEQFNTSQYQAALVSWQAALEIYQELDNRQAEGDALNALGLLFRIFGQLQTAIDLHQQALAIARDIGDHAGEGRALGNLGVAYTLLGQYEQAIDLYQQQLTITRDIGDRSGEGSALGNLGNAYWSLGQYERAIDFYEQYLAISREIDDRNREGIALGNLGNTYWSLGQYEQAIDFHEQHLAISRETGDRAGESRALGNLGNAYWSLGQYERAINLYRQDLAISQEIGNLAGEGIVLGNLGNAYWSLGQYEQAIDFHEQHLAISRETGDRAGESRALGNLGNAHWSLGQYERAINLYRQDLAISQEIGDRVGEGITLGNIGKLLNDLEQPELAVIFLKASVDVRESIRGDIRDLDNALQQSFTDTIADDYRFLADLLLQQNRIIEAQRVLDLLKVQELDDYLEDVQRNAQTETGVVYLRPEETILARYSDLQESAIAAGQELDDLKAIPQAERTDEQGQRIAQLTDLLEDINGDFRDFARSPEIRSLIDQLSYEAQEASLSLNQLDRLRDELQQLNAAIFYPLILEDRLELVITVPDSPPLRRTVDVSREELNAAILEFRTALTDPRSDAAAPAQQLYDWLVRPLEADLAAAGVETIIYSPDGQLRYIPLATLHDGDNWLIQHYRVNNITAESLTDLTESNITQSKILAAAYADESLVHTPEVNGTTYTFRGLPGAGLEVDLLPTETKYFDAAFSLEAVRPILDEYSILHFATHAAFVPGVPEDSFILFGNGDTPTLRDVEDWSLNGVDLVVLSACETGVGGLGNGEEILGLGYQFQVSGAKAVMSSLWKVSDNGTQALMAEFYAALDEAGMTKAEALQAAQTALIAGGQRGGEAGESTLQRNAPIPTRDGVPLVGNSAYPGYSHPYYWAPFILIGNGL